MFQTFKRGATSQLLDIWIGDSSSTTGAGLTGLAWNSGGLVWKYQRSDQSSATTVTTATATEGTWTSGGFKESALASGWYQIGLPDAALSAGTEVKMILYGATNMMQTPILLKLTSTDDQDAVRGGMTALPNANAGANGGLLICDVANVLPEDSINASTMSAGAIGAIALAVPDAPEFVSLFAESTAIKLQTDKMQFVTHPAAGEALIVVPVGEHDADNGTYTTYIMPSNASRTMQVVNSQAVMVSDLRLTGLVLRSDSAINTDLASTLTAINQDWGTGTGDYTISTDSQEAIGEKAALISNVYFGKVSLVKDAADSQDMYSVVWYQNDTPIPSGITSPTITVTKLADNSTLIATTAMTATGTQFRYTEGTNRTVAGELYAVRCEATIDDSTRKTEQIVWRDDT